MVISAAAVMVIMPIGCDRDTAKPQARGAAATTQQPAISSANVEKSLSAAQSYFDSRELDKAQAILQTVINRAPTEPRAPEMLGQVFLISASDHERRGELASAAACRAKAYEQYRIATELSPSNAGLQHSAGMVALQAAQPAAAVAHFQKAEKLDTRNPQYPLYAAQVLIQMRRFDDAKAALNRVLTIDANEPLVHASFAIIAMELQQFDEALSHMSAARQLKPDDLGLRAQEAKIHRRKNDPTRGLELLIGLNEAERAQEMIAYEIAACFDQLNRPLDSAKAWQHVYQADQASSGAWRAAVRAGEFLLKAGEREQAAWWLNQATLLAPDAPEVRSLAESFKPSTRTGS